MSDTEEFVSEGYGNYKCKPCVQPRGKGDMDVNDNYKFGYGKENQDEFCLNGYGPSKKKKYCKEPREYFVQEPREYIRFDRKDGCRKKSRALSDWNRFVRQRTKGSGKAVDFKKLSNEYKEMKRRFNS
jgi:hypothetical protein